MHRSIEQITASHEATAERRRQGRPVWDKTLQLGDVFHADLPFEQIRDTIVTRIRESGWPEDNYDVADLIDELAETADGGEFDPVWNAVYDEADRDRVWIETLSH